MLRVDTERWQQKAEQLREQGIRAEHPRSRERFLDLYEIAKGKSATRVGQDTGQNPQTVMEWVNRYDAQGSEALAIAATPPPSSDSICPRRVGASNGWWPGIQRQFNIECCRTTLHKRLQGLGFPWKKARKLLNQAKPAERAAYLDRLQGLLAEVLDIELVPLSPL
jgi:transposase